MSNVPEFHFDFEAVQGQPLEEATINLFKQLEGHYNEHIKPAPILFGGSTVAAPQRNSVIPTTPAIALTPNTPIVPSNADAIPVRDWEIKSASELGIKKGGAMLNGVRSDTNVEVFDTLKNYKDGDLLVEGDSGVYQLEAK